MENKKLQPHELISFTHVSQFLTDSGFKVRRTHVPKDHKKQVESLISLVERWMLLNDPSKGFSKEV